MFLGSTCNAGDLEHYDLLKDQENLNPTTIVTKYVLPAEHNIMVYTEYWYRQPQKKTQKRTDNEL